MWREVAAQADAVVVGSAMVRQIERTPRSPIWRMNWNVHAPADAHP